MGWIALALLMAGAFAALLLLGVSRTLTSFLGAALVLGAAGYAWQGRPDQPGAPANGAAATGQVDVGLSQLRLDMFGRYTTGEAYFTAGDALLRTGASHAAVSLYLGGVNAQPRNAALWTALASAYVDHDGGTVSPPARLAFDQAMRIAPDHPGPPFFLGVALVRSGEFREAARYWRRALALAPAGVSYRAPIAERLQLLDAFLASPAGQDAK